MAINSLESREVYSTELDKVFEAKSATAFLADNALRQRFVGAKTVIIPDVDFDGLADYDRNGGFTNGAVTVHNNSYTMAMDRARSLQIDREDMDEAGIASLAGKILGEYVRTKVVPECDAYVLSKLGSIAKEKGNFVEGSIDAPYATFSKLVNEVQTVVGYDEELVCFIDSYAYYALLASPEVDRAITISDFKQGEVNLKVKSINGVVLIPVVGERMKTGFIFNNTEEGGFKPADATSAIHMLVIPKKSAHLVKKTEKMRVFTPEQNANADAYKFDYRIYYDVFVKASATGSIWAWLSDEITFALKPQSATITMGTNYTLTTRAYTSKELPISYQWYQAEDEEGRGAKKLVDATEGDYTLSSFLPKGQYYYFCKASINGANEITSEVATITIK